MKFRDCVQHLVREIHIYLIDLKHAYILASKNAGSQGGDATGKQLFVPPPPAQRRLGLLRRAPRIHILDDACGQANMGELVGVLGPSGTLRI